MSRVASSGKKSDQISRSFHENSSLATLVRVGDLDPPQLVPLHTIAEVQLTAEAAYQYRHRTLSHVPLAPALKLAPRRSQMVAFQHSNDGMHDGRLMSYRRPAGVGTSRNPPLWGQASTSTVPPYDTRPRETPETVVGEYLDGRVEEIDEAMDQNYQESSSPPPVKPFTYMPVIKPSTTKQKNPSTSNGSAIVEDHPSKRKKSNQVVLHDFNTLEEAIARTRPRPAPLGPPVASMNPTAQDRLNTYLRIVDRADLIQQEEGKEPSPAVALQKRSELAKANFVAPAPVKPDAWKRDPIITNPAWYEKAAASKPKEQIEPMRVSVLSSVNIHHERKLVKAFELAGIDLIDRNGTIQGADMVLSATTAVLFRPLAKLPGELQAIFDTLKQMKQYYDRILLVFEVQPYKQKADNQNKAEINPLNNEINKALPAFRRHVELSVKDAEKSQHASHVEILMAKNGVVEVVEVLRWVMEQEFGLLRRSIGDTAAIEICEDRQWLQEDDVSF